MTKDERESLECFARCMGISFEWAPPRKSLVVFLKQNSYQGFYKYRDAVKFLALSPSTEKGWRDSGMLN